MLFNPLDPELIEDPYPTYKLLRDNDPVAFLPDSRMWMVTRHADVLAVLKDPANFSSKLGMGHDFGTAGTGVDYRIGGPGVRVLLATDPPEHQVFRQAVAAAFAPAAVRALQDRITGFARELVRNLLRRNEEGQADFFIDVAEPMPVLVLGELLGVPPEMHDEFREWSTVITTDLNQSSVDGRLGRGMNMFRYFSKQLRRSQQSPAKERRTLFDSIASARDVGVSDQEVLAFCAFLLVAGIETTTNLMTNLIAALMRFPEAQQRLRDQPELIERAVEEGLRYDTSVQALWRGTTRDVELAGVIIPADSRVMIVFGSANRDERVFAEPDRFLVDRPVNEHLGFGGGPHFCLGTRLARVEIAAVVRELLAATSSIEPAGPGVRNGSVVLRGFTRQPVRLIGK